jgi:pantoate--beta-alanine ligase
VVGATFEGAARPGHFDGMLTVVNRLMEIVEPDAVVFGEKDAQQVFLVRKLIGARWPNCLFIEAPTIRETSGLAMSSRNRNLTAEQLVDANTIYEQLTKMKAELGEGVPVSTVVSEHAKALESSGRAKLDYLAVIDPQIFRPVDDSFEGAAKIIVAVKIGEVRLIDTMNVESSRR